MANPEVDRIFSEARSSQPTTDVEYSEAQSEINLVKHDACSNLLQLYGLNFTVYCNPSQSKALQKHLASAVDLSCIVSLLWRCFYSDSDIKCNVFYDETAVIAFNKAGQIYFNIFYHNKIRGMDVDYALSHWFIVFCHELAHNKISNHGQEFGALVEHIVLTFIPLYTQKVEEMKTIVTVQRSNFELPH
ncbi:hypothetical protein GEMRC1_004525 [Eukaryota sp. GEM-RC1]